ncbi:MAG: gamma-glutamylcyclotransferase family protein [Cyanobacteria bacterium P01_E01_bin.42]
MLIARTFSIQKLERAYNYSALFVAIGIAIAVYPVFMYGSNLHRQRLQSRAPAWDGYYTRAFLPERELRFNKRSHKYIVAANIVPHPTRRVWGIVVHLNAEDLQAMDGYEGCPTHYNRIWVSPRLEGGAIAKTYTYQAHPEMLLEGKSPTPNYLGYVLEGAHCCGLPDDYISAIADLSRLRPS